MDGTQGLGRLVRALGLLAYGVLGVYPFAVSGLLVPPAAVTVLLTVWVLGLIYTIRWSAGWPWAAPIGAGAALLFWVLFVLSGSVLFGWTA